MDRPVATAPLAAAGMIAGYGVAAASGSRTLGGVVLAAFGLLCAGIWLARDGGWTASALTGIGLIAFALSHLLGHVVGAWPAVLISAAATAAACWRLSDAPARVRARVTARRHPRVPGAVEGVPAPPGPVVDGR